MTQPSGSPPPLLSIRAALIIMLAILVGAVAGGLTYLVRPSIPAAVLAGGAAAAGTLQILHILIGS